MNEMTAFWLRRQHSSGNDVYRAPRRFSTYGGTRISSLLFLLLVAGLVYGSVKYLPHLMAYRAVKYQMIENAQHAPVLSDKEILDRIYYTAESWSLPITREDIRIERANNRISISTRWVVSIDLAGNWYTHEMVFEPAVDEMMPPVGG